MDIQPHTRLEKSTQIEVVVSAQIVNLDSVTGGPGGLRGIPRPRFFGIEIASNTAYLALYSALAAALILFIVALVRSPFGLLLKAIREDELVPQALGKPYLKDR